MKKLALYLFCLVLLTMLVIEAMPAWAGPFSQSERRRQREMFTGAVAGALPAGDCIYVDSVGGRNGSRGDDPDHALQTLVRALAVASAGDTIILNVGGSETVTATIAANLARVKIVCPVTNPDSGYIITGAGTVDLMTVSAADVHIEGIKFVHTGATTTTAGVLTTAAADRLVVSNCVFDDTAIVTNFTGYGIEITNDCDDVVIDRCRFKDNHRAVLFATATGKDLIDARITGCEFWVGQATAFGIYSAPAGTGTVTGLRVSDCLFREIDGDGTTATDTWDGSDGTDATVGPFSLGAAVDQYTISSCYAETALTSTFGNLNAINAGAVGEMFDVSTASGSEDSGTLNDTTTDTLHGKLGTDTELNDNSLYDLLGSGSKTLALSAAIGSSVDGTTTDDLHGKIGTDTEMGDNSIFDYLMPVEVTGTTDIDITASDYTTYIAILTITPAAGQSLIDVTVDFDWNKATTGYDNVSTAADTLDIAVVSKIDGTNWRGLMNGTQVTANGDGTLTDDESGERFNIGMVGINGAVEVRVKLNAERADAEIPYRVIYRGAAPTITPVVAG